MPPSVPITAFDADRAAVIRMARGDGSAVAELYDRHSRAIYSLALRMLTDSAEAEDVVQDVFTQAWRQASRYDAARAPVVGWLLVMARARALDRLRARKSRISVTALDAATIDPADPGLALDQQAISQQEAATVREALAALPDGQRGTIELAYYKGLSQSEIAEQLSQPLGTVKTRMRAGLLKLRDVLHMPGRSST